MFDRQGAVVEIPDEQAQEAFQSGDFGFAPDAKIPVTTRSGKMGTIDAAHAEAVFGRGGRMLMPEEAEEAEGQAKYGTGVGNYSAAAAEGLARGISGDFSDPLAIGAARMLLGDQAAEATREHLAGVKKYNPWISGISEAAGMAAPLLVPGGAAVEGAGALAKGAEGLELLGKGAQALEEGAGAAKALGTGAALSPEATAAYKTAWQATVDEGRAAGLAGEGLDARAHAAGLEAAKSLTTQQASRFGAAAEGLGQGIRMAGMVPRANVAMGELAGKAIRKIVGAEAAGVAGRLAQKIAVRAGEAGVETALFSAEQEMDEEVLGNHELNSEKILQAAGHGAILGGSALGILTAAGGLAREVAGKAAPMMEKLAGFNMWKAAAPKLKYSKEAIKRVGGVAEVGKAALEEGIKGSTVEELAEGTQAALDRRAGELKDLYRNSPARVRVQQVADAFDEEIAKYKDQPLYSKIVKGLQEAKDQAIGGLGAEMADAAAAAHMPEGPITDQATINELGVKAGGMGKLFDPGDAGKALRKSLGVELNLHNLQLRWTGTGAPTAETIAGAAADAVVPIQKLIDVRQALGKIAYKEARALDPQMRVEALRHVYGKLADLENTEMDAVARAMGKGPQKAEIEALRKRYQRLSIYNDALADSAAKTGTNRRVSLTDYGVAIGAIASGHPVGGAVAAIGHKLLRERGSAWSAQILHRLSTYGAIDRAASTIDRQIERGVANFFRPGERASVRVRRAATAAASLAPRERDEDYDKRVERVARATAYADQHADHAARIADAIRPHAPQTAQALESSILRVTSKLAKQIPQGHVPTNTLTPHLEKPRVSEADKAKFKRADDMANDPVGTTFSRLDQGMLTRTDVANLRDMYPQTYGQIVELSMHALGSQTKKLDFDQRMQLTILLDAPSDMALGPMLLPTLQQTFGPPAPEDEPKDRGTPPRRELKDMAKAVNLNAGLSDNLGD